MTLEVHGLEPIVSDLAAMSRRTHQLRPLLSRIAVVAEQGARANLQSSGRRNAAGWPPLHPMTIAIRRSYGDTRLAPLLRDGSLLDSIRAAPSGEGVEVIAAHEAAALVQEGGRAPGPGGRGTVVIPARPFLVPAVPDLDQMANAGARFVVEGAR
ncbi:MAG: phage virion morphogenesis protein [Acidobacteriota bacterium]